MKGEARSILVLRYQQRWNYAEIAEVLGIPSGTVASRLNRARQSMKQLLDSTP